jgi:hypothetical protein
VNSLLEIPNLLTGNYPVRIVPQWITDLSKIQDTTSKAPAKPAKPLKSSEKDSFAGFAGSLYQGCPDFNGPFKTADELRQAIRQARDWQEMSFLCNEGWGTMIGSSEGPARLFSMGPF